LDFSRYNEALQLAAVKHKGQRYDSLEEVPFIAHPVFCSQMIASYGFADDVIIAALLHDAVEDTNLTIEELEKRFGNKVTGIVKELTVDQRLDWKDRQPVMWETIKKAAPEVKAIKAADVTHQILLHVIELRGGMKLKDIKGRTKEETYWKFEKLIEAISTDWQHPLVDVLNKWLAKLKELEHLM
jgi:(p)ppGpp synthase/HD superfamily hydrolase